MQLSDTQIGVNDMTNNFSWNLSCDFIAHYGKAHDENPPGRGSGRYPYGSGKKGNHKPRPNNQNNANSTRLSKSEVTKLTTKISDKTKADRKEPTGNQNCMLCTLTMEANLKGIDVLPRPVYSPRDVIFANDILPIVIGAKKEPLISKEHLDKTVSKGGRYYCHVNWNGSSGGHEFLVANIDGKTSVIDAQSNTVDSIYGKKGSYYFNNINWKNSYIYRVDNKKMNPKMMEFNKDKYRLDWDDEADIKFIEENF